MNKIYVIVLLFLSLYKSIFANLNIHKILFYNSIIPLSVDLRKRILTTVCCDDCSDLPKVEHAGKVLNTGEDAYQLMHNGIKILKDCYYDHWMTVLIELLKGHHEPQEEKAFHEVLNYIPSGAVMIELGSYWGYYSMWFQQQIPNAKNYLIEPDPKNLAVGKKNFNLNSAKGNFTHAMVGSYSAENEIFIDWNYNKHAVKQISIDDFAVEHALDFIYVLHSDIQGAEVGMLKGCKKLIAQNRIGYFFISTHRGTHKQCLQILEESNLEILLSINRKESFSADGLIIAKLPSVKGPDNIVVSRRSMQICNVIDWILDDKK